MLTGLTGLKCRCEDEGDKMEEGQLAHEQVQEPGPEWQWCSQSSERSLGKRFRLQCNKHWGRRGIIILIRKAEGCTESSTDACDVGLARSSVRQESHWIVNVSDRM